MGNPVRPPWPTPASREEVQLSAERELPPPCEEIGRGKLDETAEAVGNRMGATLETMRNELPRRLADLRQRFTVIRGRVAENAAAVAAEGKQSAQQKLRAVRTRTSVMVDRYPLQILAGVAVATFALGLWLRAWRSKNART